MIDPSDVLPRSQPIATGHLRLTPLQPQDADRLFPVLNDTLLHRFIAGRPDTLEELRARYERWAGERSPDGTEAWLNWTVRTEEDIVVGTVQATVSTTGARWLATVSWIVGTDHQGLGYATEAARALVSWLEEHGVAVIEAYVHADHAASAAVARGAGLRPTDRRVGEEVVWRSPTRPSSHAG